LLITKRNRGLTVGPIASWNRDIFLNKVESLSKYKFPPPNHSNWTRSLKCPLKNSSRRGKLGRCLLNQKYIQNSVEKHWLWRSMCSWLILNLWIKIFYLLISLLFETLWSCPNVQFVKMFLFSYKNCALFDVVNLRMNLKEIILQLHKLPYFVFVLCEHE